MKCGFSGLSTEAVSVHACFCKYSMHALRSLAGLVCTLICCRTASRLGPPVLSINSCFKRNQNILESRGRMWPLLSDETCQLKVKVKQYHIGGGVSSILEAKPCVSLSSPQVAALLLNHQVYIYMLDNPTLWYSWPEEDILIQCYTLTNTVSKYCRVQLSSAFRF